MIGLDFFWILFFFNVTIVHYFSYAQCIVGGVRFLMKNIAKNVRLFFLTNNFFLNWEISI
jgi:hypothetical protein